MGVFNNFPYANFHELNADWILEQVRKVTDEWEEYRTDMNLWKLGVDDQLAEFQAWFDNLDVQDEVRTVINELIQSGEFIEITSPQIVSATEAWLAAHVTPTTPPVDNTLSISGAAADAKVTGDRIDNINYAATNEIGLQIYYDWVDGYIATNVDTVDITDVKTSPTGYTHLIIPCTVNDKFHVKIADASSTARPWCFIDSTGAKLSIASSNNVDTYLTAPTNSTYLVCNSRDAHASVYACNMDIKTIVNQYSKILKLSDDITTEIGLNSDFNSFITSGSYCVKNNTVANSISNIPQPVRPGLLYVFRTYSGDNMIQIYLNDYGKLYIRRCYTPTTTWYDWTELNNDTLASDFSYAIHKDIDVTPTIIASRVVVVGDGTFASNSNFHGTNMIDIPEGTTAIKSNFYNSVSGYDGYAFYDGAGTFISSGKNSASNGAVNCPLTITSIPDNAKKVAFCGRINLEETGVDRTITFINGTITKTTNKNFNYNVVMLGDSIIGNFNDDDSIPNYLEQMSGAKCYNCGFGGTTMGSDTVAPITQVLEAFNGWKIINAIVTGDYSTQLQAISDDPAFENLKPYFASHIETLQNMNWNDVDIITISYGTNDWGVKVTLEDNPNNLKDTDTFGGAFRTALEALWAVYPHIKVMLCGCIWRGLTISGTTITSSTDDGALGRLAPLKDYEDKIQEIAEQYHVPFVPMYDFTGFNPYTWTQYFSSTDATHPARKGRYVMAKRYASFLAQI